MSSAANPDGRFGAFDTDTAALRRRIEAHARYGTRDLDPWVLDLLELAPGQHVLDLGCGTGKQTLPVADAVGPDGHVVAVDASPDALAALTAAAEDRDLAERITPRRTRFEDISEIDGKFDRVVSCYALYYARNTDPLFHAIEQALAAGGLFFFCGPSARNNFELREFCASLRQEQDADEPADAVVEFMEQTGFEKARELFGDVEQLEFENALRFDSPEALLTYWRSYNMYDPSIEQDFGAAVECHFASEPVFETVKRVAAVRARKAGL
jgi:SAM-dependent methyltransferase